MCSKTSPQKNFFTIVSRRYSVLDVDEIKEQLIQKRDPNDKVNIVLEKKTVNLKGSEKLRAVTEVLKVFISMISKNIIRLILV